MKMKFRFRTKLRKEERVLNQRMNYTPYHIDEQPFSSRALFCDFRANPRPMGWVIRISKSFKGYLFFDNSIPEREAEEAPA
jgi:hypothetical protein